MPTITSLDELLKHELKDLYSAETQLIDALPKMTEAATESALKKAIQQHLMVTKNQKKRLEEIQEILGEEIFPVEKKGFFANLFSSAEGEEHCKAMEGLIKEADALLREDMSNEALDAAIIAAAQKIEHYEISSYGTARAFALQLKLNKVADLLNQTLKEEYEADNSLTALALSGINITAETHGLKSVKKAAKKTQPKKKAIKKSPPEKAKASAKKSTPKKKPGAKRK
jgi:ferritin-like metal-binding protein YciE